MFFDCLSHNLEDLRFKFIKWQNTQSIQVYSFDNKSLELVQYWLSKRSKGLKTDKNLVHGKKSGVP